MRPLILKMSMSLDGFVGGPNGELDWMFGGYDEAATAWTVESVWGAGLHIMGAQTFRDMVATWPTTSNPFSRPMNEIPKAVFSKQGQDILKIADLAGRPQADLQPGAESWARAYVATGDLEAEIGKLKAQDGKPIYAHGGSRFVRSLVAGGLVDEYQLLVHPGALGRGLPIFSDLEAPLALRLMSATAFPSGAIAQIYRPA